MGKRFCYMTMTEIFINGKGELEIMKKYQVIEDNGGGLTLVVFGNNGNVEYLHSGYEFGSRGRLLEDLENLKKGDNPIVDWEGNAENPQQEYDNCFLSFEYGWEIVADNEGVYPDKMGGAACEEFYGKPTLY